MATERRPTLADFDSMTPNERADEIRAGKVEWDDLPTEVQERLTARALKVKKRHFPVA